MRTVRTGPLVGLLGSSALLGGVAAVRPMGAAGWLGGISCAVVAWALLDRAVRTTGTALGPGDWVTLLRAALVCVVAALVTDAWVHPLQVAVAVPLAVAVLLLDVVDGWVARRTRTSSVLGAHFDMEVDAFLLVLLGVAVAPILGVWVLGIGAARYVFGAARAVLPWMRGALPARYWRKPVTGIQGVALTAAMSSVLPPWSSGVLVLTAAALLAESFGRDLWWLWSRRDGGEPVSVPAAATLALAGRRTATA